MKIPLSRIWNVAASLARLARQNAPVVFDAAGFVLIVIGVAILWGDVAWLVAGFLLILAGVRASD